MHKHRLREKSNYYTWYMSRNVLGEERLNLSVMTAVIGMSKFAMFYTFSLLVSKNMSPLQITCRMKLSSLSSGPLCSLMAYISLL